MQVPIIWVQILNNVVQMVNIGKMINVFKILFKIVKNMKIKFVHNVLKIIHIIQHLNYVVGLMKQ